MELFKLKDQTWFPGDTIKNFDSLMWTERYQDTGDFQLVVKDDISILTALPLDTLISHTDTREVMIVENHEIERDSKKKLITTVTGRSFLTFTENRLTNGSSTALETGGVANVETSTATSFQIVWDLIRGSLVFGIAPAADNILNVQATDAIRVADASLPQVIKRGDVYSRILEYLKLGGYGVRSVRPLVAGDYLYFIVHDGIDRRATVVFLAQNQDLDDTKYLWSKRDYKNYAEVAAKTFVHEYRRRDLGSDVTGLSRRRMYVEASDLDGTYAFGTTDGVVASRAQNELAAHSLITLLQATISKTAKSKFKIHYDIGDIVTVKGEFGVSQPMRVTEHILTKDKAGIQGYPSLSAL